MLLSLLGVLILSACGSSSSSKSLLSTEAAKAETVPLEPPPAAVLLPEPSQAVHELGEKGIEVKANVKKVRGEKSIYEATLFLVNHTEDRIDLGANACRLYLELFEKGEEVWNNKTVACILIYDPLVLEPNQQLKIIDEHVDLSKVERGRYDVTVKMREVPWIYADAGKIRVR